MNSTAAIHPYNWKGWKRRLADIRYELDQISLRPSLATRNLLKILKHFQAPPTITDCRYCSTIPLDGRIEVLSAIKCCGSPELYISWMCEKYEGLSLIETWLIEAVHHIQPKEKKPNDLVSSEGSWLHCILLHILQMLGKLHLTMETLKSYRFGRYIRQIKATADSNQLSPDLLQLSNALETNWMEMVRLAKNPHPVAEETHEIPPICDHNPALHGTPIISQSRPIPSTQDQHKRQEPPSAENNDAKKRKIYASTQPPTETAGDNRLGRTEKPKLPAFTHIKSTNTRPNMTSVPAKQQTADTNPFIKALMDLRKNQASNIHAIEDLVPGAGSNAHKTGKPSKRVRFRPEHELCEVKIVEKLVYEGEDYEATPWVHEAARKIDANEGRYLHRVIEQMEWETPRKVVLTAETIENLGTSPPVSSAAKAQERREKAQNEVKLEELAEASLQETAHEPQEFDQLYAKQEHSPKKMKLSQELALDPEVTRLIAKTEAGNTREGPLTTDNTITDILDRLDVESNTLLGLPHRARPNILTTSDLNRVSDLSRASDLNRAPDIVNGVSDLNRASDFSRAPDLNRASDFSRAPDLNRASDLPDPNSFAIAYGTICLDPYISTSRAKIRFDSNHINEELEIQMPAVHRSSAKKQKNTRKPSQIPCKWGSTCKFGQRCHFKHAWI